MTRGFSWLLVVDLKLQKAPSPSNGVRARRERIDTHKGRNGEALLPDGIANPLRKNNPIANTRQNRNNNSAIKMFDHLEFACDQKIWRVLPNLGTFGTLFSTLTARNHFFRLFLQFGIIGGLITRTHIARRHWLDFRV